MNIYRGSQHNLEDLIKTHLFIICANNSGTTFLRNALATSENTWNLIREGQHTFGFAGPSSIGLKAHKRWASEDYWIDIFTNSENYDWVAIKKAWYFQAFSLNQRANIFIEKSPPFLLIVEQLVNNFKNAKFLFMVRNPYAVVEGIRRKSPIRWVNTVPPEKVLTLAATHVVNCLKFQKKNLEMWGNQGVFFSYEQMCAEPENVASLIKELVPELDDLNLRQKIKVKEYNEDLRNMNDQQIERLTGDDLEQINQVFLPEKDVLDFFDYSLIR
jgi:hypothetical protein